MSPDPVLLQLGHALLLGTDRAAPMGSLPPLEPAWTAARSRAGQGPDAEAQRLLDGVALASSRATLGRRLVPVEGAALDPAPVVDADEVSSAADRILTSLLRPSRRDSLLREWLRRCAGRGLRVAAPSLPAVLDRAADDPELRPALLAVIGGRGRWLARLDLRWAFALRPSDVFDARVLDGLVAQVSHGPSVEERRRGYDALRLLDEVAAVRALEACWGRFEAASKVALIALMRPPADREEAILERALDDTDRSVRRAAASGLALLSSSGLAERMKARALRSLVLHGGRLKVRPMLDDDALRDGVEPDPTRDAGRVWVEQTVARVPLAALEQHFGQSPGSLIAAARRGFGEELLSAFSRSAARFSDEKWAEALLRARAPGAPALAAVVGPARRAELVGAWIRSAESNDDFEAGLGLLPDLRGPFPLAFVRIALEGLSRLSDTERARSYPAHGALLRLALEGELEGKQARLEAELLGFAARLSRGSWRRALEEALRLVEERRSIQKAFDKAEPAPAMDDDERPDRTDPSPRRGSE